MINYRDEEAGYNKVIHKIIIVDRIVNIVLLLGALAYVYWAIVHFTTSRMFILSASLFCLFFVLVFLGCDIFYFYETKKENEGIFIGMSRILAVASVIAKVFVLFIALIAVIYVGPERFLTFFDLFF